MTGMKPSPFYSSKAALWVSALLLALATWMAYAPALHGPFLLDDYDAIFPLVEASSAGASAWEALNTAPAHIRARWLSNASFLLNHGLAGGTLPPQPFGYKLGNLLVHLASALALLALARRMAQRWGADAARGQAAALLAAGLFLLHPLLLSTVMYPVQRMAQLSTLFTLLAVLAYVRWRERLETATPRMHLAGIVATLLLTGLAVLSKETGVLAPLLILVVELVSFRWPAPATPARSRFEAGFGLVCAAPLTLGLVLLVSNWSRLMAGYAVRDFTLVERLLTQVHVVAGYAAQIAWPRIGTMGLFLDDLAIQRTFDAHTGLLIALGAAILGLAIGLRRRFPAFAFAILWFLAAHALESTALPLEMAFEHRNYLALAGPAIAIAWTVTGLRPRIAAAALSIVLLAVLGHGTWRRAHEWSSYASWLGAEAAHHPDSLRAGTELYFHFAESGHVQEAIAERERLAARHPGHAQPVLLKLAYACGGGPIAVSTFSSEDIAQLRKGTIGKDAFHVYLGLRDTMASGDCEQPRWEDFASATRAVAGNPAVAASDRSAAAWWRLNGDAHRRLQDWPGVTRALQEALARQRDDPRDWLALMHASLLQHDRAGYASARAALMRLTGGRLGTLAGEFEALERAAAAPDSPAQ